MDPVLETQENQDPVVDFDAAFLEAAGEPAAPPAASAPTDDAPTDPAAPVSGTETEEADKPQDAGGENTDGAKSDVTPAEPTPAQTEPAASTPAAPEPEPAHPGVDPKFLAQAILEEQQRLASEQKELEQQQTSSTKVYGADDFLSDADKAAIGKFKQDWAEEYPAVERLAEAHARAAAYNACNQVVNNFNKILAPLFQSVGKAEVNTHQAIIRTAHPDLDQVLPGVRKWVSEQPAFLRSSMENVLQKGNAQEVVDLVAMYKGATVQTGAAPATPASSAAQQKPAVPAKTPVDPAAVAATAAVPATQRTKQQNSADPLDFDAAFAEASVALTSV